MPIKNFIVGDPASVAAVELNRYLIQQAHVIKTADEGVNNDTLLGNDSHLFLPVSANITYWFQALIIYDGDAAGDFSFKWTAPSGSTLDWVGDYLASGASTTTDSVSRTRQSLSSQVTAGAVGAGTSAAAIPKGILKVGSSSGTFRLQWCQGTSNATATRVLAGSHLMIRRQTD